jgi:hypothetical protein
MMQVCSPPVHRASYPGPGCSRLGNCFPDKSGPPTLAPRSRDRYHGVHIRAPRHRRLSGGTACTLRARSSLRMRPAYTVQRLSLRWDAPVTRPNRTHTSLKGRAARWSAELELTGGSIGPMPTLPLSPLPTNADSSPSMLISPTIRALSSCTEEPKAEIQLHPSLRPRVRIQSV